MLFTKKHKEIQKSYATVNTKKSKIEATHKIAISG